jgi:hypothetical protein
MDTRVYYHKKSRVGQIHIHIVHTRYFWQGNYQLYGHTRCIYTDPAIPKEEWFLTASVVSIFLSLPVGV